MLSLLLLSVGLVPANPGESPEELADWIDARLEAAWRARDLPPRPAAGDDVFLRRAYLELTGVIPSVAEARDFFDSTSADKRERLIRYLLEDKRFAEHYAKLWARTLAPAGNTRGPLEAWLRDEFRKNTPFDQMAKAILTAKGNATTASPAAFYFAVGIARIGSPRQWRGVCWACGSAVRSAIIILLRAGNENISGVWRPSSPAPAPRRAR